MSSKEEERERERERWKEKGRKKVGRCTQELQHDEPTGEKRIEGKKKQLVVVRWGCGKRKMKNKCARGNTLHR